VVLPKRLAFASADFWPLPPKVALSYELHGTIKRMEISTLDFEDLSAKDRLILGLRFRLKHVRMAIAQVEVGGRPEGFEFSSDETQGAMLAELRLLEHEVQEMLSNNGADASGLMN
jgi:hypothetical protein